MRRISEVKRKVLERIKPSKEEHEYLKTKAEEIVEKLESILKEIGYEARVEVLGSFAKGTRIRGKKELDVFMLIPPKPGITRKNYVPMFEELVQKLIKKLPRKYDLRYANHPYVHVYLDGIEADLVPGFLIDDPSNIISPVDRSPFHARYVIEHTDERLRDEIRLLKQFLKSLRVYGAEIKVQGLSGYACELLVISEGSFERALKAISRLKFIDPARHYDFSEPLEEAKKKGFLRLIENSVMVIVDPVDPKRNVAAALSRRTYAKLRMAIKMFFTKPDERFFFAPEPPKKRPDRDRSLVIYGRIGRVSEDVLRGKLRRVTRIIESVVRSDENLRFYVGQVYPGTSGEYRYVLVEFLGFYSKRGKFRAKVESVPFLKRFDNVRLEEPHEQNDLAKELIKSKSLIGKLFSNASLGDVRKAIRESRERIYREFSLKAFGELKYDDPRIALRNMIKAGLPVEYESVRPLEREELPFDVQENYMRPLQRLAKEIF